ncbi:MAG: ATP-binding cassette domain-containing protein, partial [Alphaproteobacteria bacterium]
REFEMVRDFFTSATLASLTDLLFIGLFITVIYMIAGPLAWIPAVAVIVALFVGTLVQFPLSRAIKETHHEAAQKHAILIETVSALDTIKSLGAESRMQRSWERFVGLTSRTGQKSRFFSMIGINLTTLATQLVSVCTVIAGVYLAAAGELTMGAIIAAVILGGRAVAPLGGLANTLSRFHQARTALGTLNSLMALPVERPADRRFISRSVSEGSIEFSDVTFSYTETDIAALSNISFAIGSGERVGIIGRIGSGKTTIGRLLINLYEPDTGAVQIDRVDIRQFHPSDLRRGVGTVMQDVVLFHGSVRDNIALGQPQADDAMVLRAARLAGVDDFIGSHPQGYNMQVAERGQNLSGGQRQAIALARALLMDPKILMLDEPTSAMDNASEQMFIRRLGAVLNTGRTLLLTTHRMSLLRLVNRLIILEKGMIIADGPRDEVLTRLKQGKLEAGAQKHPAVAAPQQTPTALSAQPSALLPARQPGRQANDAGPARPSAAQQPEPPAARPEPEAGRPQDPTPAVPPQAAARPTPRPDDDIRPTPKPRPVDDKASVG